MFPPIRSVKALRSRYVYRPLQRSEPRPAGLAVESKVPVEDIPADLLLALLYSEDPRFFEHAGVDTWAIGLALRRYWSGHSLVGASTISQQLAKNFFLHSGRTLRRKLTETLLARSLEKHFSKNELLELYLNNIEWGPGVFGIEEACRRFFGKAPHELELLDCAYLAATVPDPLHAAGPERFKRFVRIAEMLHVCRRHSGLRAFYHRRGNARLRHLATLDLRAIFFGQGRSAIAWETRQRRRRLMPELMGSLRGYYQSRS